MRILVYVFIIIYLPFFSAAQEDCIVYSYKFKTTLDGTNYPALITNKDWNGPGSFEVSLESTSNFGKTLTSGLQPGWAVFLQPNGAWGWNIGDGKQRLDYLPTEKQVINDGQWHEIQLVYQPEQKIVWFWLDSKNVAIYNYKTINQDTAAIQQNVLTPVYPNLKSKKLSVKNRWKRKIDPPAPKDTFSVLSWNIWHGGRHNGFPEGVRQTIDIIRAKTPDFICMQETYGSGPIIADSLGMTFFYISSNLSVMTAFPVVRVFNPWDSFRFGGGIIQLDKEQQIGIFDIWLHYLPSTDQQLKDKATEGEILEAEMKTRGREILEIFKAYKQLQLQMPVIMGGDFNSASHFDWIAATAWRYNGLTVPWPVSRTMLREGFTDTFRNVYPDPTQKRGYTWSPRFKEVLQYRIDYIYSDQQNWEVIESEVLGFNDLKWPSDHAAVWSKLLLKRISPKP